MHFALFNFVFTVNIYQKENQLKRFLPAMISYLSLAVFAGHKAMFPETAFVGSSVVLTLALTFAQVFHNLALMVMLEKYVQFLSSIEQFADLFGVKENKLKRKLLLRLTTLSTICLIPIAVATLLVSNGSRTERNLFYVSYVCAMFSIVLLFIAFRRVKIQVIKVFKGLQVIGEQEISKIKQNVNQFLTILEVGIFLHAAFMVVPGLFPQGLKILIYILPFGSLIFNVYPLLATFIGKKSVKRIETTFAANNV